MVRVMSSNNASIQAKVHALYPNVIYVHCRSHVLNLAVSSSCCGVSSIRNLFTNVIKLIWFLGASAKRKAIFMNCAGELKGET